jgi:hypothetical protein
MKYLLLFIWGTSVCSTNQTIIPTASTLNTSKGPVNLSFYVNNAYEARSNNSTSVANTQANTHTKTETPLSKTLSELDIKNKLSNFNKGFLNQYKWHLLMGSTALAYSALCYVIISGNNYLGKADLWSSWRQELTLDQLLSIPQEEFAQELLQEIHRRYTNSDTINDLMTPLSLFLLALEKEEEQIKWYQYYYSWLAYLKITKVIPFSKTKFSRINERLQRITYLKNAFHSWIAKFHYKQPRTQDIE